MSAHPQKKFKRDKAKQYYKNAKKNILQAGFKGFLATCATHEKDCVRECYNILNDYANELYGPEFADNPVNDEKKPVDTDEKSEEKQEDPDDISDVLNKEIQAISEADGKSKTKHGRFQQVDTGVSCCIFIRCYDQEINPTELVERIVDDIAKTKKSKTRFLIRLTPVEAICSINMADIENTAGKLFDQHFLNETASFSIMLKKRHNNSIRTEPVTKDLAALIFSKNTGNRVDLRNPEKTVLVEVIKGLCCLSVVKQYVQNKKFNLIELANPEKEDEKQAQEEDDEGAEKPETNESKSDVEKETANEGEVKQTDEVEKTDNVKDAVD